MQSKHNHANKKKMEELVSNSSYEYQNFPNLITLTPGAPAALEYAQVMKEIKILRDDISVLKSVRKIVKH